MPLSSSATNEKQNIPLPGQKVVHCDAEEPSAEKKKKNQTHLTSSYWFWKLRSWTVHLFLFLSEEQSGGQAFAEGLHTQDRKLHLRVSICRLLRSFSTLDNFTAINNRIQLVHPYWTSNYCHCGQLVLNWTQQALQIAMSRKERPSQPCQEQQLDTESSAGDGH